MSEGLQRIPLKNGVGFTIHGAITNAAAFGHYVLKEHAPRCQGKMALGKSPARHNLENCIFDEVAGWLDAPSVTGLSILEVKVESSAFNDLEVCEEPQVLLSDILDILYDVCRMGVGARIDEEVASVDAGRLLEIIARCKLVLKNSEHVTANEKEAKQNPKSKMGPGL